MRIQFLADNDFNRYVVAGLRDLIPEIDFERAQDVGLDGAPDEQVLEYAAQSGRVLVSHDVSTMPVHVAEFLIRFERSPGVILIAQRTPIGRAIERLLEVWQIETTEDLTNQLRWL